MIALKQKVTDLEQTCLKIPVKQNTPYVGLNKLLHFIMSFTLKELLYSSKKITNSTVR